MKSMYDKCIEDTECRKLQRALQRYYRIRRHVVLEIDEGMLRKEILRMKRAKLEETRLRGAIRHEIQDIFASLTNDNSWVYGDNKPRNSRKGSVNMGFAGFGFKK